MSDENGAGDSQRDVCDPRLGVGDDWLVSDQPASLAHEAWHVVLLRFDGDSHALLWGEDETGSDRFAAAEGRFLRWDSPSDLERAALESGWAFGRVEEYNAESDGVDLEPAHAWLRGAIQTVDPVAALNLWNMATDAAYSLGEHVRDRGHVADGCYSKLVAANVPWLFEKDAYVPRWTPRELKVLRRVLGEAVHVLRTGLH